MSILEEISQPGTASLVGAVITALVSVQTVFLRWLIKSFDELRTDLKTTATGTSNWLKDHEEKDVDRHLENLRRFETISVSLARIGYKQEENHGNPIRN